MPAPVSSPTVANWIGPDTVSSWSAPKSCWTSATEPLVPDPPLPTFQLIPNLTGPTVVVGTLTVAVQYPASAPVVWGVNGQPFGLPPLGQIEAEAATCAVPARSPHVRSKQTLNLILTVQF